ncbi:ATP-binding protein [Pseudaquabacterium rugosum]|uniref:AAA family ATPase n=1 Tax=Pseudaquabacterium rugosum TaxID=2984194 RepID=A0ABU9BEM1_9BURK
MADHLPPDASAAPPPPPERPQRCFVTMLFSDLTDSTRLSSLLEAEHYAALLAQLSHAYWTVVARHGGYVVRIQGDGMLAVFGYPEPMEDDGRRATEAALELHATVRSLAVDAAVRRHGPLSLHSGIHAGMVLVGEGDIVRGRLELSGIAPNVAARLAATAQADELLISAETLGPDSGRFVIGSRRTLQLKGAPTAVEALSVLARTSTHSRYEAAARRGQTPFVGRAALINTLGDALDAATQGAVRALALVGPAGLGKTRLAHHFLDRSTADAGITVLRAYCDSHRGAEPLQPFLQLLRTLVAPPAGASAEYLLQHAQAQLDRLAPGWQAPVGFLAHTLALKLPLELRGPPPSPQAVHQGFVSLFTAMARQRPLAIFIDDWQWADDGSHTVLAALTEAEAPLLLLLSARAAGADELPLPSAVQLLSLEPLAESEAERTVKRTLPQADPLLIAEICAYAGGNPLYLEELCHRAQHDAQVQPVVKVRGGEAWLHGLIAARVARLPKAQLDLVRSAAVLGHTMPAWLFERVTGCSVDEPLVRALADADLIYPGEQAGTLRFKHGLTRDAVYEGVGLQERMRLHLMAARALVAQSELGTMGTDACEALAYHFEAGGESQQAAAYAEMAGDRALQASVLDRAKSQYLAALGSLDRLGPTPGVVRRWLGVAQRLGLASVFDPSGDDLPRFERGLQLAQAGGDATTIARTRYWLGYMHYALGQAPQALDQLRTARQLGAEAEDARLMVQIDATLGQALASAARYHEALPLLDQAAAIKRQHRSGAGAAVGLTYTLTCQGYALGDQGAFAQASACFDEALHQTGCDQPEVVGSVHGWYGAVLIWQGRPREAMHHAREAWRQGERVRSVHLMAMGRAVLGFARWRDSGQPRALDDLREAVGWLARRGNALFSSLNHGWLAEALGELGDRQGARHHAAQALRRARRSDLLGASGASRAVARLHLDDGDPRAAERWLRTARHWAGVRGSQREQAENEVLAAEIALARGQHEAAARAIERADAGFVAMDMAGRRAQLQPLRERLAAVSSGTVPLAAG